MKLLIRLAITALLANAAFRFGNEYLIHYRFTDSVREVATYRAGTDAELRQRVLETAMSYGIPLEEDGFTIQVESGRALIRGAYTKPIEVVPGFPFHWRFNWEVDAPVNAPRIALPGSVRPKDP